MLRTGGQCGGALVSALRKQQPAAQSAGACRVLSSYTERQNKKGRPVSPHVTVYRFPAVALSSIANRVTGVAMVGGEKIFVFAFPNQEIALQFRCCTMR
jgi:Succinate dehydrogenase/Fumarate reductase transmembrane subunit